MIEALPNPKYLERLLSLISLAKEEIIVVHYIVGLGEGGFNPVKKITSALVEAKRRGVSVTCVLEGSKFEENYPFYAAAKKAGIDCWMDTSKTFIHAKVVLIDRRHLIAGSQNLTMTSLWDNVEFSILTGDGGVIKSFLEGYGEIIKQRESIRSEVCREGIALPATFLKTVAAPLFREHAAHLFDLYLILFKLDKGSGRPVPIDEEGWGRQLGFDPAMAGKGVSAAYKKYYFKQRVNRVLNQLKKRFGLIEIDRVKDAVRRLALPRAEGEIFLPESYWRFGWDMRLSFAAKYFYLISVAETMESPFYPWWRKTLDNLLRDYGCASQNIGAGARELVNFGIVERLVSIPKEKRGKYSSEPFYYRNNPFYDMNEFERKIEALKEKYSEERAAMAVKIAKLFLRQYDDQVIDSLCGLIGRRGEKKAAAVARKIAGLPSASSRRTFEYFEEMVLGE